MSTTMNRTSAATTPINGQPPQQQPYSHHPQHFQQSYTDYATTGAHQAHATYGQITLNSHPNNNPQRTLSKPSPVDHRRPSPTGNHPPLASHSSATVARQQSAKQPQLPTDGDPSTRIESLPLPVQQSATVEGLADEVHEEKHYGCYRFGALAAAVIIVVLIAGTVPVALAVSSRQIVLLATCATLALVAVLVFVSVGWQHRNGRRQRRNADRTATGDWSRPGRTRRSAAAAPSGKQNPDHPMIGAPLLGSPPKSTNAAASSPAGRDCFYNSSRKSARTSWAFMGRQYNTVAVRQQQQQHVDEQQRHERRFTLLPPQPAANVARRTAIETHHPPAKMHTLDRPSAIAAADRPPAVTSSAHRRPAAAQQPPVVVRRPSTIDSHARNARRQLFVVSGEHSSADRPYDALPPDDVDQHAWLLGRPAPALRRLITTEI